MTCSVCGAAPPDGWTLCHGCLRDLDDTLAEIGRAHHRLDPRPGSGRAGGRGAPGFHSSPAASLDVILLRDPRTRLTREDRHATATVNALAGWGVHGATVDELVARLRGRLDWIAGRPWADDLLRAAAAQLRELQRVCGDLEPEITVGGCPVVVFDEYDRDTACGGRIRAQAFGGTARCGRCGSCWTGADDWRALGRALGPAEMDAAELARYFGHDTPSTIRTWASRDGWPRRRAGGRTVFPLWAAVESWAARRDPAEPATPDPSPGRAQGA